MGDKEELDLEGFCPNIEDDDPAVPVFSEEYDEYVCSVCEASLGESESDARQKFRHHRHPLNN